MHLRKKRMAIQAGKNGQGMSFMNENKIFIDANVYALDDDNLNDGQVIRGVKIVNPFKG
ncbi:hypothetical protein FACS1894110_06910 [Spirochaetia bacterium]|nr:hypothetical protein FACS1894110_06910 [Spirochaetia bacterium]